MNESRLSWRANATGTFVDPLVRDYDRIVESKCGQRLENTIFVHVYLASTTPVSSVRRLTRAQLEETVHDA